MRRAAASGIECGAPLRLERPQARGRAAKRWQALHKKTLSNEDESDVDSDDSLADVGSSDGEETAAKRTNFKPPKVEPEGNQWRCAVCRVINAESVAELPIAWPATARTRTR